MQDIVMCKNENCPLKSSCLRYLAVPNTNQTYFEFKFIKGACVNHISINPDKHKLK